MFNKAKKSFLTEFQAATYLNINGHRLKDFAGLFY